MSFTLMSIVEEAWEFTTQSSGRNGRNTMKFGANSSRHDSQTDTADDASSCDCAAQHIPNLQSVLDCMQLTIRNLTLEDLEYPADALDHFMEIHGPFVRDYINRAHMFDWNGYPGPWIENTWIATSWKHIFQSMSEHKVRTKSCRHSPNNEMPCNLSSSPLVPVFGPYIPLLIPWLDIWADDNLEGHHTVPEDLFEFLNSVLRPNVPYVTVSQNGMGLTGYQDYHVPPNVLILSSGGYGHVPIPLFQQYENLLPWTNSQTGKNITDSNSNHKKALHRCATRKYLVNYVGSLHNDPWGMRGEMNQYLNATLGDQYRFYYGKEWRKVMADSWISMAPRGFGRSAFHIVEALQMGLIPVHVYKSTKWVPYGDLFETLGFSTSMDDLPQLIAHFQHNMTAQDFLAREDRIVRYRESHFTQEGAMNHIFAFLSPEYHTPFQSDLVCQQLPETKRFS